MNSETVQLNIGGQTINLKTDNPQKLQKMAAHINEKIDQVTESSKEFNLRAAILVTLNLAEELFQERENHKHILSLLDSKNSKVQEYLNSIS